MRTHVTAAFDGQAQGAPSCRTSHREDLPFYFGLADVLTIRDQYFCSVIGPTMPNRLYSLSATIDPRARPADRSSRHPGSTTRSRPSAARALGDHVRATARRRIS
ncbi:MAG: alkaline phosphatase family protein [Acidimicrobiia bacterium]